MTRIYTVGYGGRHPEHDFLALLTRHQIALVGDVRAEPRRAYRGIYTFNPEKGTGPLPRLLQQAAIGYCWFPELGNPDRQDPLLHAFQQLMADQAEARLERVRAQAQKASLCLLCAEQDTQRCHRRVIGEYLTAYGYDVQHL